VTSGVPASAQKGSGAAATGYPYQGRDGDQYSYDGGYGYASPVYRYGYQYEPYGYAATPEIAWCTERYRSLIRRPACTWVAMAGSMLA
jgi:hypothetical protein